MTTTPINEPGHNDPGKVESAENAIEMKEVEGLSQSQIVRRRFFRHKGAMVSLAVLVFIVVLAFSSVGIDFQISTTITAFGLQKAFAPAGAETETLNQDGLLDFLSADFARALKDLAAILNDLKRLSTLGDMPIALQDRSTIRVRFPGCDAETVERLCDEVGVQRGKISQDEDFDLRTGAELALLFPFAPSIAPSSDTDDFFFHEPVKSQRDEVDWQAMLSGEDAIQSSGYPKKSPNELSFDDMTMFDSNPWAKSPSGYSSIGVSELGDRAFFPDETSYGFPASTSGYEGSDSIRKFIAECDQAPAFR